MSGRKRSLGRRFIAVTGAAFILAGGLSSTASHASTGAETFVTMISDPGDWVGGGSTRYFHPGNATVSIGGTPAYVSVGVSGGNVGDYYTFDFAAPPGRILVEGVYERAQRAPFREASRPGIDIGGDGRGCNTIEGRFEVKRITTDAQGEVDSLWIVYEQHCEGGLAALFGEVRYKVPGDGGEAVLGPRNFRWPDVDTGAATTVAPVTVVNPSSGTVSFGQARIDGPDAGHFEIRIDECSGENVPSDDACAVWVRFEPESEGQNTATLVLPEEGGYAHEIPLRAWVFGGTTRFTMESEEGDYIGGGGSYEYTPENSTMGVGGGYHGVGAGIEGEDGNWWSAFFSPPSGDILAPGTTYEGAKRAAFAGPAPGIDVSGSGRGCNEIEGEFTVEVIEVSDSGELEELSLEYEQHCEGMDPALTGVLQYRLGGEPRPLAPDPSKPAPPEQNDPDSEPEEPQVVHARSITLDDRSTGLVGRVLVADGVQQCAARVPVRLQRKRDGKFRTIARTTTNDEGRFRKRIDLRRGIYRAKAPRTAGPDGSRCARAISATIRF